MKPQLMIAHTGADDAVTSRELLSSCNFDGHELMGRLLRGRVAIEIEAINICDLGIGTHPKIARLPSERIVGLDGRSLEYGTLYYVYHDGGAAGYFATREKKEALRGLFFVGSIITAQLGGERTSGNGERPCFNRVSERHHPTPPPSDDEELEELKRRKSLIQKTAAGVLRVSPRTIRNYVKKERLNVNQRKAVIVDAKFEECLRNRPPD